MESYSANNLMAKQFNLFCLDFNLNKTAMPQKYKKKKKNGKDVDCTETFSIFNFKCPIDGIEVIDIRIKGKLNEDEIYLSNDSIYKTIRRGNSIIHKLNSDTYSMGRMGLPKFFDYSKKNSQSAYDKSVKSRVMTPIEQSKGPYRIYLTEKANGENFQVSYNTEYQAWVVGSKNVSLIVRDEKDLEWYTTSPEILQLSKEEKKGSHKEADNRFKFCLEFASLWFGIVKNKIGDRIEEFKTEIGDHTLIGENVGNKGYQHIKSYDEKDAIFYAIINNALYDKEICLPLTKSFEIFKKYNLSHVSVETSESFTTIEAIVAYLNMKYDEILLKKVSEGGEGSVVYFTSLDEDKETVLGLAKLKTFEYRFFRKVREKSKSIHKKFLTANKAFEVLEKESLQIIENLKSKVDFNNYLALGKYMLTYAGLDSTNYSNVFADFIALMKDSFDKGIKVEELNIDEINAKLIKANTEQK